MEIHEYFHIHEFIGPVSILAAWSTWPIAAWFQSEIEECIYRAVDQMSIAGFSCSD